MQPGPDSDQGRAILRLSCYNSATTTQQLQLSPVKVDSTLALVNAIDTHADRHVQPVYQVSVCQGHAPFVKLAFFGVHLHKPGNAPFNHFHDNAL